MGVNIILVDRMGRLRDTSFVSEKWNDRALLKLSSELLPEFDMSDVGGGNPWLGAEPIVRPDDVPAFRRAVCNRLPEGADYWGQLCDALEADPGAWIYFSV